MLAGPVEATAIGNVLVQARAQGFTGGDLESLRALVAQAFAPRRYEPAALRCGPLAARASVPVGELLQGDHRDAEPGRG